MDFHKQTNINIVIFSVISLFVNRQGQYSQIAYPRFFGCMKGYKYRGSDTVFYDYLRQFSQNLDQFSSTEQ